MRRIEADDWFDPVCSVDTRLFVDPRLAFSDPSPFWSESRLLVEQFLDLAIQRSGGKEIRRILACRWLQFPEPREFGLGLTVAGTRGSGIGAITAEGLAEALISASDVVSSNEFRLEALSILADGIGPDRLSDLVLNLLKSKFIAYTKEVAKRHSLATRGFTIANASFSRNGWLTEIHRLPAMPSGETAILLVPARFLRADYGTDENGFFSWAMVNIADHSDARDFMNRIIRETLRATARESLTVEGRKAVAKRLARAYPQTVMQYLDTRPAQATKPYDLRRDSELRVSWLELGRQAALKSGHDAASLRKKSPSKLVDELLLRLAAALSNGLARDAFEPTIPRPRDQWMPVISVFLSTILEQADIRVLTDPMQLGNGLCKIQWPSGVTHDIWLEFQYGRSAGPKKPSSRVSDAALVGIQFIKGDGIQQFDKRAESRDGSLGRPARRQILLVGRGRPTEDRLTLLD